MAAADVTPEKDALWTLRCIRLEKALHQAEIDQLKIQMAEANTRYNRSLLEELTCLNKLEALGVSHEEMKL